MAGNNNSQNDYYFSYVLSLIIKKIDKIKIKKIKHRIGIQEVNNSEILSAMNDYYEKKYTHY